MAKTPSKKAFYEEEEEDDNIQITIVSSKKPQNMQNLIDL